MKLQIHDPRPIDPAELTRQTAAALRAMGLGAFMSKGRRGINIHFPDAEPIYYDLACSADWTSLGPIGMAKAIRERHAKRIQEWAGDALMATTGEGTCENE